MKGTTVKTRRMISKAGNGKPAEFEVLPEDQVILDKLEALRKRIISDRANGTKPQMPVLFGEWVYIPASTESNSFLLLGPGGSAGVHFGEPVADPPEESRIKTWYLLEEVAPMSYDRIKRYYDKVDGLA